MLARMMMAMTIMMMMMKMTRTMMIPYFTDNYLECKVRMIDLEMTVRLFMTIRTIPDSD